MIFGQEHVRKGLEGYESNGTNSGLVSVAYDYDFNCFL